MFIQNDTALLCAVSSQPNPNKENKYLIFFYPVSEILEAVECHDVLEEEITFIPFMDCPSKLYLNVSKQRATNVNKAIKRGMWVALALRNRDDSEIDLTDQRNYRMQWVFPSIYLSSEQMTIVRNYVKYNKKVKWEDYE